MTQPPTPAVAESLKQLSVMIIDDTLANLRLLTRMLSDEGYEVRAFPGGEAALKSALGEPPDLILLDIRMERMDGFTVCDRLKEAPATASVPVIFISASKDNHDKLRAFASGGVDYITKPLEENEVLARVRTHLDLSRTHRNLRRSEEQVRTLLDSTAEAIFGLDLDGRCTFVNRTCLELLGCREDAELIGQTMHALLRHTHASSDAHGQEACPLLSRLSPDAPFHSEEETFHRADGTPFPVEVWAHPQRLDGEIIGRVVTFIEISARKADRERLLQSAAVFRSTGEAVAITDTELHLVAVNQAYEEITGYSDHEVLGKRPGILASGRHAKAFYQAMWATIKRDGGWQGEIWNRRKSGEIFPAWLTISEVRDPQGKVVNYVGVFSDISRLKQTQQELARLAHHDPLTGLPNRLLFSARLEHAMARVDRDGGRLALFFIDLDRFKLVNDSLGHLVGDELLKLVTERLSTLLREEDTFARVGGDEYTLIQERIRDDHQASQLAERLLAAMVEPFVVSGHELHLGASIGISLYPDDADTPDELLRNADAAMYRAKQGGRNGYHFYTEELTRQALSRVQLESELHHALANGELELYYQPQTDLHDDDHVGVEALVRWHHPRHGLLGPDAFIPLAEESTLILELGREVLRLACLQGVEWLQRGIDFGSIAVNVSGRQLYHPSFLEELDQLIRDAGLPPEYLELEITESVVMSRTEEVIGLLGQLRARGMGIAVDDFGTGYSSLAYLKHLPLTKLKIDRSFIDEVQSDENDRAIAAAIIALGASLGYTVVAEGVETEAQRNTLHALGCRQAQGFLYSHPVPAAQLERYLTVD